MPVASPTTAGLTPPSPGANSGPLLYPAALRPLMRHVRQDQEADPDDIRTLNQALHAVGQRHPQVKDNPALETTANEGFYASLRGLQQRQGLTVDGWARPGGPTFKTLNALAAGALTSGVAAGANQLAWAQQHFMPSDHIGIDARTGKAARNNPEDLRKFKQGSALILPLKRFGKLFEETPEDPAEAARQIEIIQRLAGQPSSGWMGPGSPTLGHYLKMIAPWARNLPEGDKWQGFKLQQPDWQKADALWSRWQAERDSQPRQPQVQVLHPDAPPPSSAGHFSNLRDLLALGEERAKNPLLHQAGGGGNQGEHDEAGQGGAAPKAEEAPEEPAQTLTPVEPGDTLAPTDAEDQGEVEPKTLEDIALTNVSEEDFMTASEDYTIEHEGRVPAPYYDTIAKGGELTIGAGFTLVQAAGSGNYRVRQNLESVYGDYFPKLPEVKDKLQDVADIATSYNHSQKAGYADALTSALTAYDGLAGGGTRRQMQGRICSTRTVV